MTWLAMVRRERLKTAPPSRSPGRGRQGAARYPANIRNSVQAAHLNSSPKRRDAVPKIKHIAISTQDVDATARFYKDVFGLQEVGKVDSPGASGYYLRDGDLKLA